MATLLAIITAIPALRKWWEEFMVFYVKSQRESMKKENVDAIKEAFTLNDQRPIEKITDPERAGLPSGTPGAVIVDHIPGVSDKE